MPNLMTLPEHGTSIYSMNWTACQPDQITTLYHACLHRHNCKWWQSFLECKHNLSVPASFCFCFVGNKQLRWVIMWLKATQVYVCPIKLPPHITLNAWACHPLKCSFTKLTPSLTRCMSVDNQICFLRFSYGFFQMFRDSYFSSRSPGGYDELFIFPFCSLQLSWGNESLGIVQGHDRWEEDVNRPSTSHLKDQYNIMINYLTTASGSDK